MTKSKFLGSGKQHLFSGILIWIGFAYPGLHAK